MQILRTLRSTPDLLNQKLGKTGHAICVLISSLCGSDVCSRLRAMAPCIEVALLNVVESAQVFHLGWVLGEDLSEELIFKSKSECQENASMVPDRTETLCWE